MSQRKQEADALTTCTRKCGARPGRQTERVASWPPSHAIITKRLASNGIIKNFHGYGHPLYLTWRCQLNLWGHLM